MPRFSMWALALLIGAALFTPLARSSAQAFVVVVNEAGPSSLPKEELSRIFLKKSTRLTPVDQAKDSKARAGFSTAVLGRPVTAVVSYWQQQIFSGGGSPPVERASDAEVLTWVRSNPKAIGYVAAGTDLGSGLKPLAIQ